MDEKKSWKEVDEIIDVMEKGFTFLGTEQGIGASSDEYADESITKDEIQFQR